MNIHFICYCCSFTLLVHLVVMAHHMVKFLGTTLSFGNPIDLIYSVDICDIIISVIDNTLWTLKVWKTSHSVH